LKAYDGGAAATGMPGPITYDNPGGGMSASENRMVNARGRAGFDAGSPKSTTDGKSIDADAKNSMGSLGCNPDEVSPSATSQSRNYWPGIYGGSKARKGY